MLSATQTAQRFVAHINSHDVDAIAALLTPDHRFIDSLGGEARGREALRDGWRQYFRMVPDYRIDVDRVLVDGAHVVLLGVARGTYSADGALHAENAWSTPAALRALIHDGLVAEWQVYADNEPIRRRMAGASA
jgi:ketosteroid isomerase-like protein